MNKPYQIFRIASLTMLIALAPFQGQAQSTDDMEDSMLTLHCFMSSAYHFLTERG